MSFKPMLAPAEDPMSYPNYFNELRFPLLVSPKYDGIRCIVKDGVCKSRSFKDIPNLQIQEMFSRFNQFDGELILGEPTAVDVYNKTQSVVMSKDKDAFQIRFYVFDYAGEESANEPFDFRLMIAKNWHETRAEYKSSFVKIVNHVLVKNSEELIDYEAWALLQGYEGIMMRDPKGRYKHGRGTWKEGLIYKLKRFKDDEAEIVDFVEMLHNTNEGIRNELGYIERSDTKDAKEGTGMVGKFICKFNNDLIEVAAGQFNHEERKIIWDNKESLKSSILKFRHFTVGVKDKPRFPRAVGFRDIKDL
jgi:DNA ligase-1